MSNPKSFERRWLTIGEVGAMLGMHPHSVWRLIKRGEIPAARIGRRSLRVDGQALEAKLKTSTLERLNTGSYPRPAKPKT
jgi:excisionase family DNA binding protein